MTDAAAGQRHLARAMDGYLATQLVYVAAKLGIADVLADGPRSAAQIASAVGVEASPLARVLRGLAAEGILDEVDGGRFALAPPGEALAALRGQVVARGEVYYRAAAGLLDALHAGDTAFERVYGERFFDHLAKDADAEAAFNASMAARADREARDVVAAYDFGRLRRLVDVGGGGSGVLLTAILRATPALRGVLMDRPAAIATARERLAAAGLAERAECVAGDFFAAVPPGADAYLLSRVIHDWDDRDAVRILRRCRAAMPVTARLLLVEAVLPERARDAPEAIRMDLHMLLLFGAARERTETEYRRLLAAAGLDLRQVVPTTSPANLGVIEAFPA